MSHKFVKAWVENLKIPLQTDVVLAPYTTIGIGGPAQYFIQINQADDLRAALKLAHQHEIPITVLGSGSNILISDQGIEDLVIRNMINDFSVVNENFAKISLPQINTRLNQLDKNSFYDEARLESSFDKNTPVSLIKVGSGLKIASLIQQSIAQNLVGLEWFGGIPGSVGGAVYMNIHGGHYFFSDYVIKVETQDLKGNKQILTNQDLDFAYDSSIFHKNKKIITNVYLQVYKGDLARAEEIVDHWGRVKILKQPQKSCGCIFQNLTLKQQKKTKLPTSSIGYIIDKVLGLKGKQIGGAKISNQHVAFIENMGKASFSDVLELITLIETETDKKLGIKLKKEIEILGNQ